MVFTRFLIKHISWATVGLCAFLLAIFQFRDGTFGFPASLFDYGAHIHLLSFIFNNDILYMGQISVFGYVLKLPMAVYNGMLGSHFLAAPFIWAGLTIPTAMLLVSNLSLLLLIYVSIQLYRQKKTFFGGATSLVAMIVFTLPAFFYMAWMGWYSQVVSTGFYALSLYLLLNQKNKYALAALFVAAFCYPDALLWILPVITFNLYQARKSIFRTISVLFLVLFQAILLYEHSRRIGQPGTADSMITVHFLFAMAFVLFGLKKWRLMNSIERISLFYLFYSLFLLNLGILTSGELTYRALKNTFWVAIILPIFLSQLAQTTIWKKAVFVTILIVAIFIAKNEFWFSGKRYVNYMRADSIFSNKDEEVVKLKGCKNQIVLPKWDDNRKLLILSANRYSKYSSKFLKNSSNAYRDLRESEPVVIGKIKSFNASLTDQEQLRCIITNNENLNQYFPDAKKSSIDSRWYRLDL